MNEENTKDTEGREDEVHIQPSKAVWSNKLEYILSLAGYTTGTSDFWRFPYLIWKHGGGTFILVYVFCAFLVAVPVYFLEVTVSQYSGRGLFNVWEISPIMKGMAAAMFIINFEYLAMAPTVRFWIMEYIGYSFVSPLPWIQCDNPWNTPNCIVTFTVPVGLPNSTMNVSDPVLSGTNVSGAVYSKVTAEEEFFLHKVLQISDSVYSLETLRWDLVLCNLIFTIVTTACVIKSVQSIGKAMYVLTFLPLVLLLVIWIRTLIEPGAVAGMAYFFTPDLTKLWNIQLWVQAGFTAAFSLCTANGGIMEIGSHASFRTNVLSSSLIPCLMDIMGSVFTCMVVYSVIGVMANEGGMDLQDTLFSGTSAAFVAFSRAFSYFPLPNLWLVIFFIAFLVATSDIMIMYYEILTRFLQDYIPGLRDRRKTAFALMFTLSFLLHLPFCTQAGAYFYQITEWYVATWGILTMGLLECVVFMWIYGGYMVDENIRLMNGTTMPHVIRFAASYICPVMFLVFLILGIYRYKPPVFGEYQYPQSAEVIGIVIGILPLVPLLYWAGMCIYRTGKTGFSQEGIAMMFKPSTHWGPSDLDLVANHREVAAAKRGWVDTAYYNLTGRQRKITPVIQHGNEYFMNEK